MLGWLLVRLLVASRLLLHLDTWTRLLLHTNSLVWKLLVLAAGLLLVLIRPLVWVGCNCNRS